MLALTPFCQIKAPNLLGTGTRWEGHCSPYPSKEGCLQPSFGGKACRQNCGSAPYSRESSVACLHALKGQSCATDGAVTLTWCQAVEIQTSKEPHKLSTAFPLKFKQFHCLQLSSGESPPCWGLTTSAGRSVMLWHASESIEPLQHLINAQLLWRIYKWSLLVMKLLIQSVQTRQKKKKRSKMWRLHVRSSSHQQHFNDLSGALLSNISWEHGT